MEPEYQKGKEVMITLRKAVALENNRGSIESCQAAGRSRSNARNTTTSIRDAGVANPNTSSTPVGTNRVLRHRARKGNMVLSLATAVVEPTSPKRGKRKAAVNTGAGELDLGPRKLRKRA